MEENDGRNSTEIDQRGQKESSFLCGCLASQVSKVQEFLFETILNGENSRFCVYLCSAAQLPARHYLAEVLQVLPQHRCLFDFVRLSWKVQTIMIL